MPLTTAQNCNINQQFFPPNLSHNHPQFIALTQIIRYVPFSVALALALTLNNILPSMSALVAEAQLLYYIRSQRRLINLTP